jgi:hypothetical protein
MLLFAATSYDYSYKAIETILWFHTAWITSTQDNAYFLLHRSVSQEQQVTPLGIVNMNPSAPNPYIPPPSPSPYYLKLWTFNFWPLPF